MSFGSALPVLCNAVSNYSTVAYKPPRRSLKKFISVSLGSVVILKAQTEEAKSSFFWGGGLRDGQK